VQICEGSYVRAAACIAIWNVILVTSQANLEHICCDQNNATLRHAERLSCGGRYVKDAPFVKRTAIIDNYDYAATGF